MFESAIVLGLYAETPLHPGSGSGLGIIDLPVQRERHTGIPLIQGTSLKGVLREAARSKNPSAPSESPSRSGEDDQDHPDVRAVFGPKKGDLFGGALSPTDARLLLFPVRSLQGIFVWVTCPFIIGRLDRDLRLLSPSLPPLPSFSISPGEARIGSKSPLKSPLILEEDEYEVVPKNPEDNNPVDRFVSAAALLMPDEGYEDFKKRLSTHVAVISDEDFSRLVQSATSVVTRIKLNERKTTTDGGGNMWVEEFLPSDCLFYSILLALAPRSATEKIKKAQDVIQLIRDTLAPPRDLLQVGGDETVGRGWVRVRVADAETFQAPEKAPSEQAVGGGA